MNDLTSNLFRRDDGTCITGNDYNGMIGARISSIFVIFIGGSFGALFPIIASRGSISYIKMPQSAYFIAKYFGSGVIVATSLIHLLQPANQALTDPCLSPQWNIYPYAFGICLFVMFLTFLLDIVSTRYFDQLGMVHSHGPTGFESNSHSDLLSKNPVNSEHTLATPTPMPEIPLSSPAILSSSSSSLSTDEEYNLDRKDVSIEEYAKSEMMAQIGSILFLEFGIIFHSVFIGLTLAVSGEEFKTLYIVLVFHQTFEGLGLGTRISTCKFPDDKKWVPWALGLGFGLTTPIAIAIGLGIRKSYPPNSATSLITNGIFDSISSGILIYVGLVELMAKEFFHTKEFKQAPLKSVLFAYAMMCLGAGIMALLGRWA